MAPRDVLLTLIVAGLAGLIAPAGGRTGIGRAGRWVQRLSAVLVVACLIGLATILVAGP